MAGTRQTIAVIITSAESNETDWSVGPALIGQVGGRGGNFISWRISSGIGQVRPVKNMGIKPNENCLLFLLLLLISFR